jgi:arylsulfatase A-like enzyme
MKRHAFAALVATALLASTSALAQSDRSVLPIPAAPFDGTLAENIGDARPGSDRPVRAPDGAPNVLLFMADDVGFAMSSAFGGPVPTPNMERLAATGQRYNRFHVTGICSPSRAALLTGRNHHNAGVGYLSDLPTNFPGYGGRILPETATIAQVLRLNGYNTAMFGKHHNNPGADRGPAGPFDSWPTGLGFEYYFGFPHGDTDQFEPAMFRGTTAVDPDESFGQHGGDLADKRLVDDLLRWVRNQKAGGPDKPFFVYLAPGSTHAPHQAPPEVIAGFKGQFDLGWDHMREAVLRRQIAGGVVPRGTRLTPRPPEIPAWDSLTSAQQAFAARSMEVAAAQLAYQDAQLGRVISELARIGQLDNTLISIIQGDNGSSAEAGPKGTINELRGMATHDEDEAWLQANTERLGGRMTYGSYPAGWSWAMNTPLRWMKQRASMLGAVRQGMILSWGNRAARPGSVCTQFGHLIDLAPTIYEAAGVPAPGTVLGTVQKPLDGQSLLSSLTNCEPERPRTQYFEISGSVGVWHNGWFASMDNGRLPWEIASKRGGARPLAEWTLYDLTKDFAQGQDVAARNPAKLAELQAIWKREAERNNVFPLNHIFGPGRGGIVARAGGRKSFDFWGKDVSIPATNDPILIGRSFTLHADLVLDKAGASGVVAALGSHFGGWSLWLDKGVPSFTWARSTDPKEITQIKAERTLPAGASSLTLRFASQGMGKGADIVLSSGGTELARGAVPLNYVMPAGGGETLDIGRDLGVTVTDYPTPRGRIEGDVPHVKVDID